ncbi:MAG: hypothetical protein IH812_06925 [Proteobacteria bacterium]|nr:hypothetical protein [Pseudomonadota bacterium]
MKSNQKNWTVLCTSLLVIGVPVLAFLQMNAADEESVTLVLRLTAWISFLVYVLIFITRPVRQLFASPLTRTMLNNRRYFGIVFAGSHTVHLALIIKFALDPNNLPPTLLIGGAAYALLYLMLITSFNAPAAAIGPVAWRRLHKTGLYWIGGTFTFTLVSNFLSAPDNPALQASTVLILGAISVRILAFLKNRGRTARLA